MADNTVNSPAPGSWLERRFALHARGSTVRTECLAGITGFLAAAYLLVVIPGLLAVEEWIKARQHGHHSGLRCRNAADGVSMPTCLHRRARYWRFGPGRRHACGQRRYWLANWSRHRLLVRILFFLLTRFGLREVVTRSVPQSIKLGLTASIGLFVAARLS
jgi:AGZA family xanthine/uracil permease-like MFS transporter